MPDELRQLLDGYKHTQAVHVAVELGIPDLLADGARASDDLAAATGADAGALYRLLRALATTGVLHEEDGRRFSLTELAQPLRTDVPDSVAGWVAFVGRPFHWRVWGDLLHSVRTGETAAAHVHGVGVWEYRSRHPEENEIFDRAMAALTRRSNRALLDGYDFGRFGTIVDVGGGNGTLLAVLLAEYPDARGVLFDQAHVVAGADRGERCRVVAGSFFEEVPRGGDAYVLKAILHDWEDDEATAIVRRVREAIEPGAVLLVIERLLGAPNEDPETAFMDLNMLTGPGGRERSEEEFRQLLAAGGFELKRVVPTASGMNVLESAPA